MRRSFQVDFSRAGRARAAWLGGLALLALLACALAACAGAASPAPSSSPTAAIVTPAVETPAYPYPLTTQLFPAPTAYPAPATQAPAAPSVTVTQAQAAGVPSQTAYPTPVANPTRAASVTPTATSPAPTAQATETSPGAYPPPATQEPGGSGAYPPPETQAPAATGAYPGPVETAAPTTQPQETETPGGGGQPTLEITQSAGALPGEATAVISSTLGGTVTPTEALPGLRPTQPGGTFVTVTIWHSWTDVQFLEQAVQAFQSSKPNISFALRYVPFDELQGKFAGAAYYNEGPTLVLGPSDWGAKFYADGLVEDLTQYISPEFKAAFNPAALGTVQFRRAIFGLPYSLRGPVLYRNQALIPHAAGSYEQALAAAQQATHGGVQGFYLDWGMAFSGGFLEGLNGRWLNDQGQPLFDQGNYQAALAWLGLLQSASKSGALVEFNGTRDLALFKQGKVGMFVESSGLRFSLAEVVGDENLAIDPWPTLEGGRLSGFVASDAVYLNTNAGERSALEKQAGLEFMGLLMTSALQHRFAELGFVPAVRDAAPRDRLTSQAAAALATGAPYPAVWQDEVRSAYWSSLNAAAQAVAENRAEPAEALKKAYQEIVERLKTLPTIP